MSYPNYTPPVYDSRMYQRQQDDDHLRLLAIFHYVLGGIVALGALYFLLYFGFGLFALNAPEALASGPKHSASDAEASAVMGWILTAIGGIGIAICLTVGGLTAYAGKCLKDRKGATLINVISVINCLHVPIGTVLGVFTLVVLSRPTVKALFAGQPADVVYAGNGQQFATGAPNDPQQPWYRG